VLASSSHAPNWRNDVTPVAETTPAAVGDVVVVVADVDVDVDVPEDVGVVVVGAGAFGPLGRPLP